MITSNQNPKVKLARSLLRQTQARRAQGAFVLEGVRLAEEALNARCPAQFVLYSPDLSERGKTVVEGFAAQGVPTEAVAEKVFLTISDTQTPQGILVVLPHFQMPLPTSLDFVLILDVIQDPGNLGTILRTAAAAGVQAVFLTPGTVDPFSPKVVRAAMGAHFRLPIHSLSWEEIEAHISKHSLRTYLASPYADTPYTKVDLRSPLALIIGSEAEGAGDRAKSLAHIHIHIPMPGAIESLNASVAAAILMFEVVRQRDQNTLNETERHEEKNP